MTGMGGGVGLIAGGLLTTYASWRWVFFVTVPIGLLLAFGARYVLPESQRHPRRWDVPRSAWLTSRHKSMRPCPARAIAIESSATNCRIAWVSQLSIMSLRRTDRYDHPDADGIALVERAYNGLYWKDSSSRDMELSS